MPSKSFRQLSKSSIKRSVRRQLRLNSSLSYESFEPRAMLSATLGDSVVTFNELLYNPGPSDTGGEWIELHNQLSVDVDLSNWSLSGGIEYSFAPGTTIGGGDYLVVAKDAAALQAAAGITGVLGGFSGSLSNGGETIHLLDHNDRILDELIYEDEGDWPVAADGSGATLAKTSEHLATGDFDAWHFSATAGGTPGAANSISDSNLLLSELSGATDANFRVELENTGNTSLNLSGYSLVWDGDATVSYVLSGSVAAGGFVSYDQATTGFDPADGDKIFLTGPGESIADGAEIKQTARARSDQWDGRFQRPDVTTFGAANSFDFQDAIVINEILYHQISEGGVAAETSSQQLVAFDSIWRYNQTNNQIASWASTSHVSGVDGWESGPGLLGVEGASLPEPILTGVNEGFELGRVTYYFEADFNFTGDPADFSQLTFNHIVDDGAVFYLNGVEVERFNIDDGVDVNSTTTAVGVGNAARQTFSIDTSNLVSGTNRLSVEVHQTSSNSSDIVFGTQVIATGITTPGTPFIEDPEEWIELYNNSNSVVDLSNWELGNGVEYTFAADTTLAAGEYLVIANDNATLAAKYPNINIAAGEFSGKLSNSGELIQLVDATGNIADEVRYYDDGQFDARADGGGSSLELRDPNADNSNGQAWSVSDSGDDSQWQTVTYSGVTTPNDGTTQIWNEFVFGLLNDGEILIDDISVIFDPGGANVELIQNGSFDNGLATYRAGGNHRYATIVADPDDASNSVLQLRTTGTAEHILNHVETTFVNNTEILIGENYQISYRAKWISGTNQLNSRLYFNNLPHTERLTRPKTTGTPGAVNFSAESNIGPTYEDLQQSVVTPGVGQSVQISVAAEDPDGVANLTLWYSANEGAWRQTNTTLSNGRYTGTIPGFGNETVVQFYVEGTDNSGASSTFPAAGRDSRALYKVNTSAPGTSAASNSLQIVMLPSESTYLHDDTNTFSNDQFGATVIDETGKIYYDVGTRLKGSAFGRNNNSAVGFWIGFNPEDQYRGVHDSVTINRNGLKEIFAKHLLQYAGEGVGSFYDDIINLESATGNFSGIGILNLARYGDVYLDGQYEDGSDGNVYNLELLYKPQTTIGGVEDLKNSFPYTTADGRPDFTSLGSDEELYRYNFQLENNRAEDDFSGLIEFVSTFDLDGDALYEKANEVLDLDQFVRTFTANSIVGTDDTYTRLPAVHNAHNLRLFDNPEDGKFVALPWDLDRSFRLPTNDPIVGQFGTLPKLFNLPQVKRLFYGHAEDIINTVYTASYVNTWGTHYGDLVNDNGDFNTERNYIFNRSNGILAQLPDSTTTNFEITTNNGSDFSTADNQVTLQGTGSYQIREILIDGFTDPLEVTWLDDTNFEVVVNLNPGTNNLNFAALDFSGNEIHADAITVTSTDNSALAQDHLRVTEIHYHPTDPTGDELAAIPGVGDNDFEFIELVNTSLTQSLNLEGVQFVEQVLNNDNQGITFTFGDLTLSPGERIVVVENIEAFELRYGTTANVAGQYSGALSNGGETITLLDATGQTIQQFAYDDVAPFPTSPDGGGASLIVVDTEGDYNSGANWVASTPSPDLVVTPVIDALVRDSGSILRPDLIDTLAFEFNTAVDINKGNLTLTNATLGGVAVNLSDASFSYDSNSQIATLDLSTLPDRLEAGYYDITVSANVTAVDGSGSLDGDGDGTSGGDYVSRVYVAIPGDANLDGIVTNSNADIFSGTQTGDLAVTLGNIGTSNITWADGNFNADGDVDQNQSDIFSSTNEGDLARLLANLFRDVRPSQPVTLAPVTLASTAPVIAAPAIVASEAVSPTTQIAAVVEPELEPATVDVASEPTVISVSDSPVLPSIADTSPALAEELQPLLPQPLPIEALTLRVSDAAVATVMEALPVFTTVEKTLAENELQT